MYVALVTEDGEELERVDRIERVWDIMPSPQDSTFAVLCEIDEYGDTTFNHLQLPRLLEEWARLYERTNEQTKLAVLTQVRVLAEECLAAPHRYLKFVGD
ncbi:MAG TPA: hypothetical protein VFX19_12600 [Dehalococcoidia bacterium]|nr:hypothetical protein [Dehalococcoidia bacterium]